MKTKLNKLALDAARDISIQIWNTYDNTHGYRSEKVKKCQDVSSDHPDNMLFFWQQFDYLNQMIFLNHIHELTDGNIKEDLVDWVNEWIEETTAHS